jgi:hypothetical protein
MEIANRAPGDVLISSEDKGGIMISVGMVLGSDAAGFQV